MNNYQSDYEFSLLISVIGWPIILFIAFLFNLL